MNLKAHKKKLIPGAIACGLIALLMFSPLALKPGLKAAIRSHGFPKASVGDIRFLPDGIYIDKIFLDPDGFSQINSIQVEGSWPKLIGGHAEKISIKSIDISGELDRDNRLTIAGWDGTHRASSLPFEFLYIDGITLDLDTPIGAIRTQARANIDSDSKGGHNITAMVFASQEQLSTSINFKGRLSEENKLSGRADIEDTNIDAPPLTLSRLSGWAEFKSGTAFSAAGQIMAGALKYKDVPFQNANLTFDTGQDSIAQFQARMSEQPVEINIELATKPAKKVTFTASSANLGNFSTLAGVGSDALAKSGPAVFKADINLTDQFVLQNQARIYPAKIDFAGGLLTLRPFIYYMDGRKNSFVIDATQLRMAQLMDRNSVISNGSLSGVIPVSIQNKNIEIDNGFLKSDASGSFKYTPKEIPAALQGNAAVRKALSDYHYDSLQIELDGNVNGNLKAILTARGTSPAFKNQPGNLNLNLAGF